MDRLKNETINDQEVQAEKPKQQEIWKKSAFASAARDAETVTLVQQKALAAAMRATDFPFVGESPIMLRVFELLDKVADTDSTCLILGESGTGKELVARALHQKSARCSKPFVPVNCGAIPSELLESELFGHVKGAFTGAHASRIGRFSLAHEGTLFLDEIGTMPASLQVKLLRALQERQFEPVGSTKTLKSDCRVIAATNEDLELQVERGEFREDLYYRLNVIPIQLPPLRDRRDDIPLLITHFIELVNRKNKYAIDGIAPDAMEVLMRYNWPGNVRELENICQRLCIMKREGVITMEDLPSKLHQTKRPRSSGSAIDQILVDGFPDEGLSLEDTIQSIENELMLKALEKTSWNKNKAAQLLRMNRTTLVEKIKKRGLRQSF